MLSYFNFASSSSKLVFNFRVESTEGAFSFGSLILVKFSSNFQVKIRGFWQGD